MRRILELYLQSSLHVSFSICALTGMYYLHNDIPADTALLLFTFCASVVGYNFIKYAPLVYKGKWTIFRQFPFITLITSIALLSAIFCIFYLSVAVLSLSALLGFLVFWYTFPITGNSKNLRHYPLLKLFTIALVWSCISLLFPVLDQDDMNLNKSVLFFDLAERMIWVMVLMVPFEIRDADDDSRSGRSMINSVGVKKAKSFAMGLLFLFIFLRYMVHDQLMVVSIFIYASLFILLIFTKKDQHRFFSALFVESLPMFWFLWAWISV